MVDWTFEELLLPAPIKATGMLVELCKVLLMLDAQFLLNLSVVLSKCVHVEKFDTWTFFIISFK